MSNVTVTEEGGVRIVTLDRPPLNAINLELVAELSEAFAEAAGSDCEALVLTGANGVFSAGIDTRMVPQLDAESRVELLHAINAMVYRLFALPKPAVAAVPGHAIGAGLILPLACDVRLAARGDYKVGLTEAKAGVPFPAGPLTVLLATLSPEKYQYLALDSEAYPPDSPLFEDVFERLVDPEDLLDAALDKARSLVEKPAFALVKSQIRREANARLRRIVEDREEPLLEQGDAR